MTNVAIITARAGSESIPRKNVHPVGGRPLVAYSIQAAQQAKRIGRVFVCTDCLQVEKVAQDMGCDTFDQPKALQNNHGNVIRYAVKQVRKQVSDLNSIVLLLGNTVMVDARLIDESLAMLAEDSTLDSVMSVWEAGDDHPYRALELEQGLLKPFGGPRLAGTSRQSYPRAYYYDQGVWTFRHTTVDSQDGPNPWWWMGKRCKPIVREWMTGRDVHSTFDIELSEWWLKRA